MGNRGILHDEHGRIRRQWAHKAWVSCVLSFNGIKRPVFAQGSYSELFFLDEATALAAGHRPCKTCQRDRHIGFKSAWLSANDPDAGGRFTPIAEIDARLHAERAIAGGGKQTYDAPLAGLPDGTMVDHKGTAFLVWQGKLLEWTFDGYRHGTTIPSSATVQVFTPRSIVRMYAGGYVPRVHASAET